MEIPHSLLKSGRPSKKVRLKQAIGLASLLTALSCLPACKSVDTFTHQDADMAAIKSIAVIPFANNSQDRLAGEKMTNLFITELLINTKLDVVEPGETLKALSTGKKNGNGRNWNGRGSGHALGLEELRQLGKTTGANTIILGSVDEYKIERTGQVSFPVISMTVRAVDVEAGKILWMCSVSDSGRSRTPIVDIGAIRTLSELGQKVCRRIAETLGEDH